jgi:hypothetical protein
VVKCLPSRLKFSPQYQINNKHCKLFFFFFFLVITGV